MSTTASQPLRRRVRAWRHRIRNRRQIDAALASGVEIVLGDDDGRTPLYDPHARMALSQRVGAMPSTARFYIRQEERYLSALLDYVMVSPRLRRRDPRWRIWHPFDDPVCYRTPELREALLTASDHFPVSLDLDLS